MRPAHLHVVVQPDWTIEIPEELRNSPGVSPGETVRIEAHLSSWEMENADPVSVFRALVRRAQEERHDADLTQDDHLLPPSAAEEAAIERYDRIVREHDGQGKE